MVSEQIDKHMEKNNLYPFLPPYIEQYTITKIVKILEKNYREDPPDLEVCTDLLDKKIIEHKRKYN